ncbi:Copper transport protein [Nymphaea thermarum]|nr:Copper transport protein [Nymphaea thermarum]
MARKVQRPVGFATSCARVTKLLLAAAGQLGSLGFGGWGCRLPWSNPRLPGGLDRKDQSRPQPVNNRHSTGGLSARGSCPTVVLRVGMTCEGCVGAVKRVLNKMEGVESYDVDMKEQKVTVRGNIQPDAVLQTVSKTGKTTSFWEEGGNVQA